jgi:predicted transcriptional regulator
MNIALSDLTQDERAYLIKETARAFAADLKEECEGLTEMEVAGLLRLDARTVRKVVPFVEIKPGVRRYSRAALIKFLNP